MHIFAHRQWVHEEAGGVVGEEMGLMVGQRGTDRRMVAVRSAHLGVARGGRGGGRGAGGGGGRGGSTQCCGGGSSWNLIREGS